MDKLMGLKIEIYFNRTEDIIVQSHLNPEAQVFVPSVKVCIFIKQVKKKKTTRKKVSWLCGYCHWRAIIHHQFLLKKKYHLYNLLVILKNKKK